MKYLFQLASLILLLAIFNFVNPLEETSSSSDDLPHSEPSVTPSSSAVTTEASSTGNSISTSDTIPPGLGKVEDRNEAVGLHNNRKGKKDRLSKKYKEHRDNITIKLKKPKGSRSHMKQTMAMARAVGEEEIPEAKEEIEATIDLSRKFNGIGMESYNFEARYLDETEINFPMLKHYELFVDDFYPPWTYAGFFSPLTWHRVPIEYFTRPSVAQFDGNDLKKHKSAMHICSHRVTEDTSKCYEIMENECLSDMPSPINIITDLAEEDDTLNPFEFLHFDTFFGFTMFIPEDGTDLLFLTLLPPKRASEKKPGVSEGSVGNKDLFLDRILFHFENQPVNGSEHSINGKRYGMEIQLFFTGDQIPYWESVSKYKFLKPNDPNIGQNMHIFSVMVSVGRPGATTPDDKHEQFSPRFELLSLVATMFWEEVNEGKYRAVKVTQKLLSLEDFLGVPSVGPYYTYEGSLSHPPCFKYVKWTIFENPIWITFKQWARFASIKSEFSDILTIAGNIRSQAEVLLKLDLPTYLEMRKDEGLHSISKGALEREVRYKANKANASNPEVYVIRRYTDFPKYYAKKVTKLRHIKSKLNNNDDYYDETEDVVESSSSIYCCTSLITPTVLLFILYLNQLN